MPQPSETPDRVWDYGIEGEEWREFIRLMRSGERVKITNAMFFYWLEILPPVFMSRYVELGGDYIYCNFGFAEGEEQVVAFWNRHGEYHCQATGMMASDVRRQIGKGAGHCPEYAIEKETQ